MYKPRYVRHRLENDCVVTCLAMVTGHPFTKVLKGIKQYWEDKGQFEGTSDEVFEAYLAQHGYAIQYMHHEYAPTYELRANWPPAPFAPIHVCDVFDGGMHATVMLADGSIMDPNDRSKKRLTDYHRVFSVAGIFKVTPLASV